MARPDRFAPARAGARGAELRSLRGRGEAARWPVRPGRRTLARSILEGGTDGNERLTSLTGAVLLVLLAVIGVTIVRIGQLISVHLFVGYLLLGPVALKLASTGYRFVRYYSRNETYREKGPPHPALRVLAPGVVLSTLGVFVTGIVLMFEGPAHRDPWLLLHKVTFIVWIALTGLHVLGHLPTMARLLPGGRPDSVGAIRTPGSAGRGIALVGALVAGAVLAVVLIPHFGLWTAPGVLHHHHHNG
jgi:hypothetical protein